MNFPELDPRLAKWPLMESATPTYVIVFLYLVFIKILGPVYMKNREPYSLRKTLIFYNLGMVAYSTWIFYKLGKHGWFNKYSWICEPINYSVDEDSMGMVLVVWHFYISKFIELLDTIFFILRKKDSNVTWLHVIHHSTVPPIARFIIAHGAGGYNVIFAFANSFVHIWMYLYYGLAAVGPSMQKYLWWKKYLTIIQMIQFVMITVVMVTNCLMPGCQVNAILILVNLGTAMLFLVLFANFYRSSYSSQKRRQATSASKNK